MHSSTPITTSMCLPANGAGHVEVLGNGDLVTIHKHNGIAGDLRADRHSRPDNDLVRASLAVRQARFDISVGALGTLDANVGLGRHVSGGIALDSDSLEVQAQAQGSLAVHVLSELVPLRLGGPLGVPYYSPLPIERGSALDSDAQSCGAPKERQKAMGQPHDLLGCCVVRKRKRGDKDGCLGVAGVLVDGDGRCGCGWEEDG